MINKCISVTHQFIILCLIGVVVFTACDPSQDQVHTAQISPSVSNTPISHQSNMSGEDFSPKISTPDVNLESNDNRVTPPVVKIAITSQPAASNLVVKIPTPTFVPTPSPTPLSDMVMSDAEPLIFTGMATNQKCGHGDVVAYDGHSLRATPRILHDNSNFLELLPEGTQVDIIDCRLWTDRDDLSWLAVRTTEGKLGWMLIQSDSFYVTLYPIPLEPPPALTGIPAGTMVAYVPPSECKTEKASNEAVATSIGVDLIPVVGDAKGLTEAATGCDMVTGESLGHWRWFGLLGIVGLSEIALLRHGDDVGDVARIANNLEGGLRYSDEVVGIASRNTDEVAGVIGRNTDEIAPSLGRNADELLMGAGKIDNAVADSADAAKSADNARVLSDEAVQALAKFEQPCSFSGDTLVATETGFVPIKQMTPGAMALAYDETVGTTGYFTVTNVFTHVDSVIITLKIGSEEIETTPEHPFYIHGNWTPADAIKVGDIIFSAPGTTSPVQNVIVEHQSQVMYNITVATAHTYFVGTGEWLVHNACSQKLRRAMKDTLPEWATIPKDQEGYIPWQAHHIIPGELENHQFLKRVDWNIDGATNGIALPKWEADAKSLGLPAHRGYHGDYSAHARSLLDELEDAASEAAENGTPWSKKYANDKLKELVEELQLYLRGSSGGRLN